VLLAAEPVKTTLRRAQQQRAVLTEPAASRNPIFLIGGNGNSWESVTGAISIGVRKGTFLTRHDNRSIKVWTVSRYSVTLVPKSEGDKKVRIRNNLDYETLGKRLETIVRMRGESVPDFKSRMDVVKHIKRRWRNSFEDIIETGCLLILNGFSARDFPRRKPSNDEDTEFLPITYHTARRIMMVAESERINNPVDRNCFSDCWYVLYLLAWMPKSMFEKGKLIGVIHKSCTERDIVDFIRREKGLPIGEKIVIHVSDRPLSGAQFQEIQDQFEGLRDGLIDFLHRHREAEVWGRIVTGIEVKKRCRLPKIY